MNGFEPTMDEFKERLESGEQPLWLTLEEAALARQLVAECSGKLARSIEKKIDDLFN